MLISGKTSAPPDTLVTSNAASAVTRGRAQSLWRTPLFLLAGGMFAAAAALAVVQPQDEDLPEAVQVRAVLPLPQGFADAHAAAVSQNSATEAVAQPFVHMTRILRGCRRNGLARFSDAR